MGSWSVSLTTDKDQIEAFLRRDPVYAAYAIGDLEPEHAPFCTWRLAEAVSYTHLTLPTSDLV